LFDEFMATMEMSDFLLTGTFSFLSLPGLLRAGSPDSLCDRRPDMLRVFDLVSPTVSREYETADIAFRYRYVVGAQIYFDGSIPCLSGAPANACGLALRPNCHHFGVGVARYAFTVRDSAFVASCLLQQTGGGGMVAAVSPGQGASLLAVKKTLTR
jgi:hypothetical protein